LLGYAVAGGSSLRGFQSHVNPARSRGPVLVAHLHVNLGASASLSSETGRTMNSNNDEKK
jgi:hypothetical protein